MVRSYNKALSVEESSKEAMVRNQHNLAIAIVADTKEESFTAKMPGTTTQARESFVFKVSSELEGTPKTKEYVDYFLAIKSASFVKIVNSLSDCLYSC